MGDTWNALADPTRRKILHMLREGDKNAGEIAAAFSISKPSISHHLNVLREAGLVDAQKQGQNIFYSLNTSVVQDMMHLIAGLLGADHQQDAAQQEQKQHQQDKLQ